MSDTPIYDALLTEDGPPLAEDLPRIDTQFAMAFAMDTLSDGDKARIGLTAENESIGWWSRRHRHVTYVEPVLTAGAIMLAEEMAEDRPAPRPLPDLPWMRNTLAIPHA